MKPEDFKAWRLRRGISREQAALELGLSPSCVKQYELGHKRGSPIRIPKLVGLACGALEHGFLDYAPG